MNDGRVGPAYQGSRRPVLEQLTGSDRSSGRLTELNRGKPLAIICRLPIDTPSLTHSGSETFPQLPRSYQASFTDVKMILGATRLKKFPTPVRMLPPASGRCYEFV